MILGRHALTLLARIPGLLLLTCLPAKAVDLSNIYDRSVQNDPQIAAAEALYLSRTEVVSQARSGLLPFVSIGASTSDNRRRIPLPLFGQDPDNPGEIVPIPGSRPTERFNSHGWQAILNQPIFRMDRWYQFQQSKNIKAQALAQFASDQQELIVRVTESYLDILESQDALSASNAERDAVGRQLEQVQQRFDVGLVAITDVLESIAAYDSSTVNVIETEGAQSISFQPLLRLTGDNIETIFALSADFPVKSPEPENVESWVETALRQNYALIAAREAVKTAEKQILISKSGFLPTIDAQASWTHSVSGGGNFFGSKFNVRALTLRLNLPLYTGGNTRSVLRQSGFQLEETLKTFDLTQRTVVENTNSLFIAIVTDVARVRARLRGIESSQTALEATQTGYEVGTRNIVDVLRAQQLLFFSLFQHASARYQYIRDTFRLKQVVGSLSPDDVYDLNKFIIPAQSVNKITPMTR